MIHLNNEKKNENKKKLTSLRFKCKIAREYKLMRQTRLHARILSKSQME